MTAQLIDFTTNCAVFAQLIQYMAYQYILHFVFRSGVALIH